MSGLIKIFLATCLVVVNVADGKRIVELQTKTGDGLFDGMDINGRISVDICTIVASGLEGNKITCCQVIFHFISVPYFALISMFDHRWHS